MVNSRNFNKFESLVTVPANKPDIVAINETWEKHDSFGEYRNLSGYTYISNPRLKSKGGGVGLIIKDKLYHLHVYLAKMNINLAKMKFNLAQMKINLAEMKFKLTLMKLISCFFLLFSYFGIILKNFLF